MTSIPTAPTPVDAFGFNVARYAYYAEAALWDYQCGQTLYYDQSQDHRRACVVFAEAARSALIALQRYAGGAAEQKRSANLLGRMLAVRRLDKQSASLLNRDGIEDDLRMLSRVLRENRRPIGRDFLLRDLYDDQCIADCKAAAEQVLEPMTLRLLGMGLEKSLGRLWRVRRTPMVDALLWERLGARARRMHRKSRDAGARAEHADGLTD